MKSMTWMAGVVMAAGALTAAECLSQAPALNKERETGFTPLFNGKDLSGFCGATNLFYVENGELTFREGKKNYGNLMTEKKYSDFILRLEFKLTPNGNNGIGIRASDIAKDAAYYGMEIQVLDNSGDLKQKLRDDQYHGSIYGVVAAERGQLLPVGQWNREEIRAIGPHITVALNGAIILDADISKVAKPTPDNEEHPGLHNREGYIGFLGHTMPVKFRNVRIKEVAGGGQ